MIVALASPDDPRVAAYRGVRERDLLRESGTFIVEGAIALERLIAAGRFAIESVFLSDNRVEPLTAVLAKLDNAVPVYTAPQAGMDAITGFHIHRGVLAMARRGEALTMTELLGKPGRLTVQVLIGLSNHDNVGGCFRNAAALGADAVLLDSESCDPLYRKSIRVSSGAALTLPFARGGSGAEIINALDAAGIERWALTPSGSDLLQTLTPPERLAIVLGAEGPGLPPKLMDSCRRVRIPMAPGMDSLNVATAGAIALAHVFSRRV